MAALLFLSLCGGCSDDRAAQIAEAPSEAGVAAIDGIRPTGPDRVGIRVVAAGDEAVWLYYPAADGAGGAAEPQAPPAYGQYLARRFGGQAAADLLAAAGPASWNAPPAAGTRPLVIFTPGAALGSRDYRALIAEIASHGFVVAAQNPHGSPAASEERYAQAAEEIVAVARSLGDGAEPAPAFDRNCILLVGHSLGGAASVLALGKAPAFVAAVNLDGDYAGAARTAAPARPILYVTGTNEEEGERTLRRRADDWAIVSGGNRDARRLASAELRHLDVLDAALLPTALIPAHKREGRFGPLGGRRVQELVGAAVTDFLREAAGRCVRQPSR